MTKKSIKTVLFIALCACFFGLFIVYTTNAGTYKLVSELFIPSGVVIEPVKKDSALNFNEDGLRITSKNPAEKLAFKDAFSGELTLDYAPDKESGEFSFRKFTVSVTDILSGQSFDIIVDQGSETFYVSVSSNGSRMGIYYPSYGVYGGLTELCNEDGIYTKFKVDRLTLAFDPVTMSVYAGEKGVDKLLVWNFSDQMNDGKNVGFTLDTFKKYTVAFGFDDYLSESGSVILYGVNGCALDKLVLSDETAPVIFVPFEKDAVVGEEYTLPTPHAFDLYYGELSGVNYEIFDPNGKSVGKNLISFTPDTVAESGKEYKIVYTAVNPSGATAKKEYSLKAYNKTPKCDISLNWNNDGEYFVGSKVFVPKAIIRGGLIKNGAKTATVTVKKNGIPLRAFTNVDSGFYFTLNNLGEYIFSYDLGSSTLDYSINAVSDETAIIADGVESSYLKGQLVDLSGIKVKADGKFVDYSLIIEYPDGTCFSNKKFIAEQMGEYVLTATATDNGKTYSLSKSIFVYGKASDLFESDYAGFSAEYDRSRFTGRAGVKLSTTQSGAIMNYTQEIDLDDYRNQTANTKTDGSGYTVLSDTAIPLIDMSLEPLSYGAQSASTVYIYLTDVLDPTNKITIVCVPKGSVWWTYIRANAPSQKSVGFYNGGTTVELNNAMGRLESTYGFMTSHSFLGELMNGYTTADSKIELFYDADKKQLLTHPQATSSNKNHIIMDFDDPLYCEGMVWNGFSSDKIKISVALTGLKGTASVFVYSVGGREFNEETLNYDVAPQIAVETPDGATIEGMKGKEIKVPSASAVDKFGSAIDKITTKVYYDYNGERLDITLKNGKFTTARTGNYYIVYTASDMFGNTSEKTVNVFVKDSDIDDIKVDIKSVADSRTHGKTLDRIIIGADEVAADNTIGETAYEIKLYYIDGGIRVEKEILEADLLNVENYFYFIPEKEGEYQVEYVYTDSVLRTGSDYYTVTIENPSTPVVVGNLPYYIGFIRGNYYDIAPVNYIDYSKPNAKVETASLYINGELYTEKTVVFDYCKETHPSGFVCDKVHVEEQDESESIETVVLEYKAGDFVLIRYELPVKNVKKYINRIRPNGDVKKEERILYDRYFVTDGNMTVTQSTGASSYLLMATSDGEGSAYFAQPLSASNPSLKLDVDFEKDPALIAKKTTLKGFYITLTDALDKSKSVTVYVYDEENINVAESSDTRHSTVMKLNGNKSNPFNGSLVGKSLNALTIGYRNDTHAFYDDAGESSAKLLNVNYYDDGRPFEGFGSFVFVSVKLESDGEPASLRLYNISGHSISNTDGKDEVKPIISVDGATSGVYSVGDKVKVLPATASDVLSYVVDGSLVVTVTVKNGGEEKVVSDINGKPLNRVDATAEYEIILSEMGTYNFTYNVMDSAGNEGEFQYAFKTINRVKPKISLDGKVPLTIEFGKEINIPVATVEFMEENEQNVSYALIIAPNGSFRIVSENKFVASEAGYYTLRYYALDSYGNYELIEYELLCK